jgi:hypothetical protein
MYTFPRHMHWNRYEGATAWGSKNLKYELKFNAAMKCKFLSEI